MGEGAAGKLTSVSVFFGPTRTVSAQPRKVTCGSPRGGAERLAYTDGGRHFANISRTDGFIVGPTILSGRLQGSWHLSSRQKRSKQSNDQGRCLDFMEWAVSLCLFLPPSPSPSPSLPPTPSLALSPAVSDACKRSGRETKKNIARLEKVF